MNQLSNLLSNLDRSKPDGFRQIRAELQRQLDAAGVKLATQKNLRGPAIFADQKARAKIDADIRLTEDEIETLRAQVAETKKRELELEGAVRVPRLRKKWEALRDHYIEIDKALTAVSRLLDQEIEFVKAFDEDADFCRNNGLCSVPRRPMALLRELYAREIRERAATGEFKNSDPPLEILEVPARLMISNYRPRDIQADYFARMKELKYPVAG